MKRIWMHIYRCLCCLFLIHAWFFNLLHVCFRFSRIPSLVFWNISWYIRFGISIQHPAFNIQHPPISHLWITMICYFAKNIHFPIRLKIFSIEHFPACTNLYPSWHIEASTRNMLFVLTMLFGAKPDSRVDDKMDLARESLSFLDESEFGIPSRLANQLGQSFREQLT